MSIANPNWLTVVGLLYSGIGVLLVATAIATTASMASLARSKRAPAGVGIGGIGAFGGLLAAGGFLFQALAQFHVMPQNGAVAFMMLSLIGLLGAYGIAALRAPASVAETVESLVTISAQQPFEAAAPVGLAPATVKLVSTG